MALYTYVFSNQQIIITCMILYPNVEIAPQRDPAMNAPPGCIIRSAIAPTATPPLKVAF